MQTARQVKVGKYNTGLEAGNELKETTRSLR